MATVCFVGLDSLGVAQLAEGLARSRSEGLFSSDAACFYPCDEVSPEVREAMDTSRRPVPLLAPRPMEPEEFDHHGRVIVLGFRNAQGFVPLPVGIRPSVEVWPIETPEDAPDEWHRVKGLRKNLERRLARLVYDLSSPDRDCCGSGCANCVLDR
ncbi:hypothetical protein [Raineyella fluvialis]|uniref:Protein-tyrosine-phosphatase n=1 Tax=Raineyella fluvialis TaxID=2662261 RepID=A0A5Q2FFT9_9ACTN|nr:hypothetical protein [Raineyella fluvialis]QGF24667.1 hypothetical protein Rai3103_14645 [Raineyella fluvialis]